MLPGAVPCEAFDNGLRRENLQLGADQADVGFLFHRQQISLPPKRSQVRAFQDVQEVKLYPLGTKLSHHLGAFQHVFGCFPGKTVDQMDAGAYTSLLQGGITRKKI